MAEAVEIDLDSPPTRTGKHWADYVTGVALMLQRAGGRMPGADLLIDTELPVEAGLSSSAALAFAVGSALASLCGMELSRLEFLRICQRAENEFVGVRCGIMDQFICAFGQDRKALLLDCRSLEFRQIPVPDTFRFVICSTMVRHSLGTHEYNVRRQECEEAVTLLKARNPAIRSLRDVDSHQLKGLSRELPPVALRRARHIVHENARTLLFAEALLTEDIATAGQLMTASHVSLRDDFQVSCGELDQMVSLSLRSGLSLGARMTGGGFGGCTVNIVTAQNLDPFMAFMREAYQTLTGVSPEVHACLPGDGYAEFKVPEESR